jgi:hypothetical protein
LPCRWQFRIDGAFTERVQQGARARLRREPQRTSGVVALDLQPDHFGNRSQGCSKYELRSASDAGGAHTFEH